MYLVRVLRDEHILSEPNNLPTQSNVFDLLEDNIVLKIFEDSELKLEDLCQLAITCTRFSEIAKHSYRRNRNRLGDYAGDYSNEPLWLIDSFIENFATAHESVDMTLFGDNQDIVAGMIDEHCRNVCELRAKAIEPSHIQSMRPLMQHVRKLDLICSTSVEFNPTILFGSDTDIPLEALKIQHKRPIVLPSRKLPNLNTLYLKSIFMHDEGQFEKFFELNPQITKLYFEDVHCYFQLDNIVRHYLGNLEEFAFVGEGTPLPCRDMLAFSALKSLRKLFLWVDERQAILALEALNKGEAQLECVTLGLEQTGTPNMDGNLAHSIGKLQTLTRVEISNDYIISVGNILEASYSMTDADLLYLIQHLPNLKEVRIESHVLTLACIQSAMTQAKQLTSAKFSLSDAAFEGNDNPDFAALAECASRERIRLELEILPSTLVRHLIVHL